MTELSTPYEATGRVHQKARTRAALLDATDRLLADGQVATVEAAADLAGISRSTAYRYFRNQAELISAAYPDLDTPSLLGPGDPVDDAGRRVEIVVERLTTRVRDREMQLRAQLRLALAPGDPNRDSLPLRRGRAVRWLEDALEPLGDRMSPAERRRLALAIRATTGIEAYVWLTDVGRATPEEAVEIMRSSARTLVDAALQG